MRWIYIVSILLLVLMTSVQCQQTEILDHGMASNIDESTSKVTTRFNTFSSTDSKAYSWLNLGNVGDGNSWSNLENLGAGSVEWYWYSPDNTLYKADSFDIPTPKSRAGWPSYYVWSFIDIADIANLPGNWHVDVYLDGQKCLTEKFALDIDYEAKPVSASTKTGTKILDHCMSTNVDEATNSVITRTHKFLLDTDSKVYSWLSLGNVEPGTFYWHWNSADGTEYTYGPINIPPNPSGGNWPSYNVWSSIDTSILYGETNDLELPSNEFYVDVTRNGYPFLGESFTVDRIYGTYNRPSF